MSLGCAVGQSAVEAQLKAYVRNTVLIRGEFKPRNILFNAWLKKVQDPSSMGRRVTELNHENIVDVLKDGRAHAEYMRKRRLIGNDSPLADVPVEIALRAQTAGLLKAILSYKDLPEKADMLEYILTKMGDSFKMLLSDICRAIPKNETGMQFADNLPRLGNLGELLSF